MVYSAFYYSSAVRIDLDNNLPSVGYLDDRIPTPLYILCVHRKVIKSGSAIVVWLQTVPGNRKSFGRLPAADRLFCPDLPYTFATAMFSGSNSSDTVMGEGGHSEQHIVVSEKGGSRESGREEPIFSKEKEEEAGYQSPAQASDGNAPPDGGLRAWLVVIGAWCTSVCSFGWINSTFIFIYGIDKFRGVDKLTHWQKNRCWSVPGLLPNYDSERIFAQYRLVDPIFADFLHDGLGKLIDAIDTTGACRQL